MKPLLKNIPFIKNNELLQQSGKEDTILEELCQVLTLFKLSAGHAVFRYGDYGTKFFIIIHGTVSVHVPMKREMTEEEKELHPHKRVMTEVARLQAPNSFGELALLEYKPRAATIRCVTD